MEKIQKIRCALYTRKSTEEGLDKEFNTLEAQREAGVNYVRSQVHQGWEVIDTPYDDPGFSGGNMNRPALQRLLSDVQAGKVDMIVVYKIDRLTRSLLDFSKLIQVLDAHKCSFVSVTQHFNTYDSMGRLTLNVLLSFAQFEREVTSERIRDKMSASRKKGMWMGGTIPMGYDVKDKKLAVNPEEAEIIRHIFEQYLQLRSEQEVCNRLNMQGLLPKKRVLRNGAEVYGVRFNHARISSILRNPIYTGKIRHNGAVYEGRHAAIVSDEVFQQVQAIKSKNRAGRLAPPKNKNSALLRGLLHCECCNSMMVTTKSNKASKVYEYYTSVRAVKEGYRYCSVGNIPAGVMDDFVLKQIKVFFNSPKVLNELIFQMRAARPAVSENEICAKFKDTDAMFNAFGKNTLRQIIELLVAEIWVNKNMIKICLTDFAVSLLNPSDKKGVSGNAITCPAKLGRRRGQLKIIVPDAGESLHDEALLAALKKAFAWQKELEKKGCRMDELAKREKISRGYLGKILKLTCLAPDIVEAVALGKHPESFKIENLMENPIPVLWSEQRKAYGFM